MSEERANPILARLLVVDDSATQRESLRFILGERLYSVETAANGPEALAVMERSKPDLVIADIVMPGMDGHELCRRIKANPAWAGIPVVLLTSLTDVEEVIAALQSGADSFVGKPFAVEHLLGQIAHLLANRRGRAQEAGEPQGPLNISFGGRDYVIGASRRQILDLLLSVYQVAVARNTELLAAQRRLKHFNEELEQKVRDRTSRLEESNRSLETFCYSIAHDLRAPLRGIQGFLNALLEEHAELQSAAAEHYAQRIRNAAQRMDHLICDLLAFGRISQSDIALQWVDVKATLQKVTGVLAADIESTKAVIRVNTEVPRIYGNAVLLEQIFANLLGNSLKFIAEGRPPEIVITSDRVDHSGRVVFADNGIGIDPKFQHKVFNLFEKLHSDNKYAGTGIGLALVKKAMDRMGGTILLESELGRGTRFELIFPEPQGAAQ